MCELAHKNSLYRLLWPDLEVYPPRTATWVNATFRPFPSIALTHGSRVAATSGGRLFGPMLPHE